MIPEQGWQCPLCKRIYSPRQEMCLYCGGEKKESINVNGPFIDYPFEIDTTKGPTNTKETNGAKGSPYYTTTTGAISLDSDAPNAVLKEYKENTNASTM